MVTFYGAGERTGIMNVENKLAKALGKDGNTLVVKAADRDIVLNEISAQMARYEKIDQDMYLELKALRQDVKEIFNKGMDPGDDILEQLYFLEPKTRDLVERMSKSYNKVVTPDDFKQIAMRMSEHLGEQVPILKTFTRFFGRLAEDYFASAKPKEAEIDNAAVIKRMVFGARRNGARIPTWLSRIMGIKDEPLRDKILNRIPLYDHTSLYDEMLWGAKSPETRRTGFTVGKYSILSEDITKGSDVLYPNKLPKSWTSIPWVNFDGKTLEQAFTQTFEERLRYKDKDGNWITNIVQVQQKTDPNWWEEFRNKSGKINDIADINKARTAYAVNGNHSNDATLVKQYHIWGKENGVATSTVHDAFFQNAADMLKGRSALRGIYANAIEANSIKATLDEMRKRGLPKELYEAYLEEAIELGLIPVVGKSKIGGKVIQEKDVLKKSDILKSVPERFDDDYYFYGVG